MRTFLSLPAWLAILGASACTSPLDTSSTGALTYEPLQSEEGCAETANCLFGEVFADVRTRESLEITSERWINALSEFDTLSGVQFVRAVQQSSHTDVTTPAEALERVDQNEVRRVDFLERATGRAFVVFEYGAGDNSYGAYFAIDSPDVLAAIHDRDVLSCTVFEGL